LRVLGPLLSAEGWSVAAATRGEQALKLIAQRRPDLILLDVMMPEMDGPTTFKNMQDNPATKDIPVMLLTAKVQGVDQRRFASLGVAAVLFKPFDPLTLSEQISTILGWQ
jgi:CheY-like chemotaxis protein